MALTRKQRKALPKSAFAIPEKAPGPGSYPIENPSHGRNALARSSGKSVAGRVRAAVMRKYPGMGKPMNKATKKARSEGETVAQDRGDTRAQDRAERAAMRRKRA